MVVTQRHIKNMPYTDAEINDYCDSVDRLLKRIKEDKLLRKRKKLTKFEVVEEPEVVAEEDEQVLM
ncbi:MAG: hypothetical protein AB1499_17170 [Nitrospirota bacterium]